MVQPSDEEIREILLTARRIAVIGIKDDPQEDAHRVPRYLQRQGYRVVPVNPKLASVLGEPCHGSVREVAEPVEVIDVFRAPEHIPAHVDEILALPWRPRLVWLQLGIRHPEATARLEAAGVRVVQDRCLMVEHARLLGSGARLAGR